MKTINLNNTTNPDFSWDAFAGSVATVNDRPDKFFCRVCGEVWAARGPVGSRGSKCYKPGAKGYNRCPHDGVIYEDSALVKLSKPSDKFIHLLTLDGVKVTVQRSYLASVWEQFVNNPANRILAIEQGVDLGALALAVSAMKCLTPSVALIALATPVAMPTEADWEKWAAMQEAK